MSLFFLLVVVVVLFEMENGEGGLKKIHYYYATWNGHEFYYPRYRSGFFLSMPWRAYVIRLPWSHRLQFRFIARPYATAWKKGTPHISMQPICIRDKYITNRGCDTFSIFVCVANSIDASNVSSNYLPSKDSPILPYSHHVVGLCYIDKHYSLTKKVYYYFIQQCKGCLVSL